MPASELVRHHPDARWLATAAVVGGLGLIVTGAEPGSFDELLPAAGVYAWAASLLLGGALILTGIYQKAVLRAAAIERMGRIIMAWATMAYGFAIVVFAGWSGVASAALIGFYGFGCAQRARHLRRVIPGAWTWRHPFRGVDSEPTP